MTDTFAHLRLTVREFVREIGGIVCTERPEFTHQRGGYYLPLRRRKEEHCFHFGVELSVYFSHSLFVHEILCVAYASDEVSGVRFAAVIDCESGISDHFHLRASGIQFLNPLHTLFQGKRVFFVDIVSDGDNDFVE